VKKKMQVVMRIFIGFGLAMGFSPLINTCGRPLPHQIPYCQALERQILSATVRIQFHGWIEIEDGYDSQRVEDLLVYQSINSTVNRCYPTCRCRLFRLSPRPVRQPCWILASWTVRVCSLELALVHQISPHGMKSSCDRIRK